MPVLENKTVIVTGAGRGLGRAYAIAMAHAGARVVVNDIDYEEAHGVVRAIRDAGGEAIAACGSVGQWDEALAVVGHCVDSFGGLDVLVNNAGLYRVSPLWETTEEDLDEIIGVNLKGSFAMAHHAARAMIPSRQGCIINVTSGAQMGLPGRSIYSGSKAGVASLTYTLALELAPYGIRVNAISPLAQTRMSETSDAGGYRVEGRPLPQTVGPLVVFLASDAATNVTGQVVRLAGNTLSLFLHPKPFRPVVRPEGWDLDALKAFFSSKSGRQLEPVGLGSNSYAYSDGAGQG